MYAAHQLVYNEPCFPKHKVGRHRTPVAEGLQKRLMLFTTNQENMREIRRQADAMLKTLAHYSK